MLIIYCENLYIKLKKFSGVKISQWFLDPLIKTGPDFIKNKNRILSKSDIVDTNFVTTSPDQISFLNKKIVFLFLIQPIHQLMLIAFLIIKNHLIYLLL